MATKLDRYEEDMNNAMTYAIAGFFILPIVFGYMSKSYLRKVEEKFEIPVQDKWKRTLINWIYAKAIIATIVVSIYFLILLGL